MTGRTVNPAGHAQETFQRDGGGYRRTGDYPAGGLVRQPWHVDRSVHAAVWKGNGTGTWYADILRGDPSGRALEAYDQERAFRLVSAGEFPTWNEAYTWALAVVNARRAHPAGRSLTRDPLQAATAELHDRTTFTVDELGAAWCGLFGGRSDE
ncbi:hypothetical protein GCM10009592_26720 [Brachybacterium rhamnosum]|uniref:Uncharacterized protein n=1 Tax=Brachybacterium rhamnosum TaxID=173361 RepID=A0ABW4PZF1_9MICO